MAAGRAPRAALPDALVPIAILSLVWGCNWPILKLGVTELQPLTFRALSLPFAGMLLLAVARLGGDDVRVPRALWPTVALLALFNIAGWNALVLFGLREMPASRGVILAYTMPLWATLIAWATIGEPLSKRKLAGLALGMTGMLLLLARDLGMLHRNFFGAAMILGAAICWACGTVLLRKLKPPIPQNALSGWMMIIGWIPIGIAAPLFDPGWHRALAEASPTAWFAILYNIFLAGTAAHWAWFTIARTLPVAVSSLASLPVPVIGVFAGMLVLGERPGAAEWIALALVLAALVAVLLPAGRREGTAVPDAPEE